MRLQERSAEAYTAAKEAMREVTLNTAEYILDEKIGPKTINLPTHLHGEFRLEGMTFRVERDSWRDEIYGRLYVRLQIRYSYRDEWKEVDSLADLERWRNLHNTYGIKVLDE